MVSEIQNIFYIKNRFLDVSVFVLVSGWISQYTSTNNSIKSSYFGYAVACQSVSTLIVTHCDDGYNDTLRETEQVAKCMKWVS